MEAHINTDQSHTDHDASCTTATLRAQVRRTGKLIEVLADVNATKDCVTDWFACSSLLSRTCDRLISPGGYQLARITVNDAAVEGGHLAEASAGDQDVHPVDVDESESERSTVVSLEVGDARYGSLAVRSCADDGLSSNECALLSQIAIGLAQALDHVSAESTPTLHSIRVEERLFEECFEGVSVGMMFLRGHNEPVLVNRAFADFLGYDQTWFDGMSPVDAIRQITHPEDREKEMLLLHQLMERKQSSYTFEKRFVRANKSIAFGLQTTTFFFDPHGTFRFGVASIQDITEFRDMRLELRSAYEGAIEGLVAALESRDPYTVGHQDRVAQLACAIAARLELTESQTAGLRVASTLHDIGKIAIPAEILTKPYGMTDAEFTLVQDHPRVAHEILKGIRFPWPVADIVLQHHERMDGSGYPKGLRGDAILLEARIIAVADTVEALASHRPYRPAMTIEQALGYVDEKRGELYDERVVDACMAAFEDGFVFQEAAPFPDGRRRLV